MMFIFFEKLMKNEWQTEEYEDIFLYFYFRRRRKQRLENEQREKKIKFGVWDRFSQRGNF